MQVKFKKINPEAIIPSYSQNGDAGMDLTAISQTESEGLIEYGTGLSVEIPQGFVGLIFPRSSIFKTNQILSNSVGVIDSGYRGEIKFKFYTKTTTMGENTYFSHNSYQIGDRIGQLIILPYPNIEPLEVNELTETDRGEDGFGSTGK